MTFKACLRMLLPLCLSIFILSARCNANDQQGPSPKAVIDQDTFTFTPVIAGTEVTHLFHILNKGDAVLKIPGVYSQ